MKINKGTRELADKKHTKYRVNRRLQSALRNEMQSCFFSPCVSVVQQMQKQLNNWLLLNPFFRNSCGSSEDVPKRFQDRRKTSDIPGFRKATTLPCPNRALVLAKRSIAKNVLLGAILAPPKGHPHAGKTHGCKNRAHGDGFGAARFATWRR
jgi:hypothetical protein